MQKTYTIYKLISPSGKIYIGQTGNIQARFWNYKSIKKLTPQYLLSKEILQYKFNNFTKEILFFGLSKEEANNKEIELIAYYKSLNVSLNIADGGYEPLRKGKITYKVSKKGEIIEIYNSISEAALLNNLQETLIWISIKQNRFFCKNMFFITKEKYDSDLFNNRNYIGKCKELSVIQLSLDGQYITEHVSASKASKITGVNRAMIQSCCTGNSNRGGNFLWVYKKDYNANKSYKYNEIPKYNIKGVIIIDKITKEEKYYNSISECVKDTKISKNIIAKYCNNNNENSSKRIKYYFKWKE